MPRIFGVGRASTDKQTITPEAQNDRITLFLKYQREVGTWDDSYQWVNFFCDKAVSGSIPFRLRPYGNFVFTSVQPGDIIVAADFDRAFRDTVDFLETTALLRERKVGIILLDIGKTPLDTSDPAQEAMLTVMAAFKQYERRNIGKRINDAFDHLRATRGSVRPKCGWKLVPKFPGSKEKIAVPDQEMRKLGAWVVEQRDVHKKTTVECWRELWMNPKTRKIGGKEVGLSIIRNAYWSAKHGWPQTGLSRYREGYVRPKRAPCLDTTAS